MLEELSDYSAPDGRDRMTVQEIVARKRRGGKKISDAKKGKGDWTAKEKAAMLDYLRERQKQVSKSRARRDLIALIDAGELVGGIEIQIGHPHESTLKRWESET